MKLTGWPGGDQGMQMTSWLNERFEGPGLDPRLSWHCPPPQWRLDPAGGLLIETAGGTDFWQRTHYGFQADNGHFLFTPVSGNFVLATHVRFHPVHQYDQAGLMVRISPSCWLKTSVEYEPDGPARLGAVVTNDGWSDWSTQNFPPDYPEIHLRIRREGADYVVESSVSGANWTQLRMAHLHEDQPAQPVACGVYACSPKTAGYRAYFEYLRIELA